MSELSPLDNRLINKINNLENQSTTQAVNDITTTPDWIERNPGEFEAVSSNEVETSKSEADLVEVGNFVRYSPPGIETTYYNQIAFIEEVSLIEYKFKFLEDFNFYPTNTTFNQFGIYTGQSPLFDGIELDAFNIDDATLASDGTINVDDLTIRGHMVGSLLHVSLDCQFDITGASYVELQDIPGISDFFPFAYEYNNGASDSIHFATQNSDNIRFSGGINNANDQTIRASFYYVVKGYTPGFVIS